MDENENVNVESLPVEEDEASIDGGRFVIATRDMKAFVGGHSDEIYGFWVVEAVGSLEAAAIFRHRGDAKAFIRDNADELRWEGLDPDALEIYPVCPSCGINPQLGMKIEYHASIELEAYYCLACNEVVYKEIPKRDMTVPEAEDFASAAGEPVTDRAIRHAAAAGYIPGARKSGRDWLIPYEGFNHYLDNRPKPGRKR